MTSEAHGTEVPSTALSNKARSWPLTSPDSPAPSSMKRFTNPPHFTSLPNLIRRIVPRMQAQQSLFQSAFKDPNQRTAHGVKKSIPFLNLWAPSADVQKLQAEQKRDLNTKNMASATSFYDFKPLDSTSSPYVFLVPVESNASSEVGWHDASRPPILIINY